MSESGFNTNIPHGANALPAHVPDVARMIVEEVFKTGSGSSATPTGIVRARLHNGTAKGTKDYFVYTEDKEKAAAGKTIFAARPSGGTGKKQGDKPVEWIEINASSKTTSSGPGKQWDVWTRIDDSGTEAWTRPRFTKTGA